MRSEIAPITSAASAATATVASRCSQPLDDALADQDAGGVGAEADERGVAERDQAGVAEHEVEAGRGDRVDDDAAGQAEVEVEAERAQERTAGRSRPASSDRQATSDAGAPVAAAPGRLAVIRRAPGTGPAAGSRAPPP